MKFRIEIDENTKEPEIVIRCSEINDEVLALQKAVSKSNLFSQQLILFRDETEFFIPISEILFFETDERGINAHTVDNVYQTKLKLYEIEGMFPQLFMRISKSSMINVNKVNALAKTLSGYFVRFTGSIKEVYISRMYYKQLRDRLEEDRRV